MSDPSRVPSHQEVVIVDIQMPLGRMVVFILKWFVASIPVLLIFVLLSALFSGLMVGLASMR